jgi:ketosteroid isomerase-like protein
MTTTISITDTAAAFFEACESGQGWAECAQYCAPDAAFAAQSEALTGVTSIEAYSNWMQGLHTFMSDVSYEVTAFGTDVESNCVVVSAVFSGAHTGEGGPVPPTGKSTASDYAYNLQFDGEKIARMTKIWHSGLAMQDLGWA